MNKFNLIFDATVLANGNENTTARSGVFFVAYNLLLEFSKRENLNIFLYTSKKQFFYAKQFVDKNFDNLKFINLSFFDEKICKIEFLKKENKKNGGSKIELNKLRIFLFIYKILSMLQKILTFNHFYSKQFSKNDIFFSPRGIIPNDFRKINNKNILVHDLIPLIFPENFPEIKKKKSELYKICHDFDRKNHYFANSEYTKSDLLKFSNLNESDITVVPLATGNIYTRINDIKKISDVKNKYKIAQDKKYIFSLCSLEPRKNLIFAVKNFIEFIKKNKIDDFIFVLGGGHWDAFISKLNSEIENLDEYKDKIIKIGYVDDEDLSALYSGAEMFVFPSIYEGFGMPVLEAMQCGCPVITSNLTSMPEVIGDCGIKINPNCDKDLQNAFEKMYSDEEFRKNCIEKGLERAKNFTWEKCVDIILETMNKF